MYSAIASHAAKDNFGVHQEAIGDKAAPGEAARRVQMQRAGAAGAAAGGGSFFRSGSGGGVALGRRPRRGKGKRKKRRQKVGIKARKPMMPGTKLVRGRNARHKFRAKGLTLWKISMKRLAKLLKGWHGKLDKKRKKHSEESE